MLSRHLPTTPPPPNPPQEQNPAPRDPDPPPGPVRVKTWRDAVKILFAVLVWVSTTDLARQVTTLADRGKLPDTIHLFNLHGFSNEILWVLVFANTHGVLLGLKALVLFWMGPEFFQYLYPVFTGCIARGGESRRRCASGLECHPAYDHYRALTQETMN